MSVMMVFVPKHVQTLLEASLVDVILDIYWRLMGLHAVVCAHVSMSIHACNYILFLHIWILVSTRY